MGKLNNVLSFKEYENLQKLENKPGKLIENNHVIDFDSYNENWFTDKYDDYKRSKNDREFEEIENEIMKHPIKNRIYSKIKGTEKGNKYVEFFIKYPNNYPKWDNNKNDYVPTGVQSYNQSTLG